MIEELGLSVEVLSLVDAYLYTIKVSVDESRGVLVLSYLCKVVEKVGDFELEGEAGRAEFKLFGYDEINGLNMPDFYKRALMTAMVAERN